MTVTDLALINVRKGTAAEWVLANSTLLAGEFGYETDTKLVKMGDGTTAWNSLGYMPEQLAAQIHIATAKTTPVDADLIPISDSAASFGLKSLSWANIKATFDTLYARFKGPAVNTQTASYVLIASDVGKRVVMNAAGATTITVNTSLFGAADTLEILNIGAGVCTITAGTATVSTAGTLALVQNAGGKLYFTSAGVSVFIPGDVASAAGGGMTLLSTTALTGAATINITGIDQTYQDLKVRVLGLQVDTGTFTLKIEPNGSVSLCTWTDINGATVAQGSGSYISPGNAGHSATDARNNLVFNFYDYANTSYPKPFDYRGACKMASQVAPLPTSGSGIVDTASAMTSLSLNNDSGGNFTGGSVEIWGRK